MSEQRATYVHLVKRGPAFGRHKATSPGLTRAIDELGGLPGDSPRDPPRDVPIDRTPIERRAADRATREPELLDLARRLALLNKPRPALGYVWCRVRAWAWAMAWPDQLVALEVVTGPGLGWLVEMAKGNEAAVAGWCVLRVTPAHVADGTALRLVGEALAARERE